MPDPLPCLPETLILPEKTVTGRGTVTTLAEEAARFGQRGVLVHGSSLASTPALTALLARVPSGVSILPFQHRGGEPSLEQVSELREAARRHDANWIAAIGGGSVLDLAKAAAALHAAPHPVAAYHDGRAIDTEGLPFLAAPSTAGTGSEATINAVLTNTVTGAKKSIRAIGMMARVVVLDADLIATCPGPVIAASGMDALTQAIEGYTSRKAVWLSDQLALQGLALVAHALQDVYNRPGSPQAADLLTGSYLTGIAFSFARLGVVHGLAHPLGSLYHVPHGLVCAACLPYAIELNREAYGHKYQAMSDAMGGDLLERVHALIRALRIVSPFAGQELRERDRIVRETLASGSTQSNPKPVTAQDVTWLLERLFAHS